MRLNQFALIIILFLVISISLSLIGILSVTIIDILSYLLIVVGMALVYGEGIRQKGLSVFVGSVIFLMGVYFLISENFTLNINDEMNIPLILIFSGSGLLVLHIMTSTRIIFLIISIVCLSSGITLFIMNSRWNLRTFSHSVIPVFNYLWPTIFILAFLLFLLQKK